MNEHLKNVEALVRPYTPTVAQGQQWEFGIPGWVRGKDGALVCVDKEEMAKQNGVLTDLVKQLGSALLKVRNVLAVCGGCPQLHWVSCVFVWYRAPCPACVGQKRDQPLPASARV